MAMEHPARADHQGWRDAASARLDGEDPGVDTTALDDHLAACGPCRSWLERAHVLARASRLAPAPAPVDLAPTVLEAVSADRARRPVRPAAPSGDGWVFRVGLALVAVVQLAFAAPDVFAAVAGDPSAHALRELGAWDGALAVGLLYAAWRPRRTEGLLPLLAALVGFLVLLAVVDVADGQVSALSEAHHFLAPLGLGLVWVASQRTPARRPRPVFARV